MFAYIHHVGTDPISYKTSCRMIAQSPESSISDIHIRIALKFSRAAETPAQFQRK